MGLLSFVLFGAIVGGIANFLDPRPSSGGILGSIVLGIVGAFVGGWLGNMILGVTVTGFNLTSFILALVGAFVVLYVGRALTNRV